jgi:hypothetical protein
MYGTYDYGHPIGTRAAPSRILQYGTSMRFEDMPMQSCQESTFSVCYDENGTSKTATFRGSEWWSMPLPGIDATLA